MGYTDPILFLSEGTIKFDATDVVSMFDWVSAGMLMGKNQQFDMCALAFSEMTGAESSMLCDTGAMVTVVRPEIIDRLTNLREPTRLIQSYSGEITKLKVEGTLGPHLDRVVVHPDAIHNILSMRQLMGPGEPFRGDINGEHRYN